MGFLRFHTRQMLVAKPAPDAPKGHIERALGYAFASASGLYRGLLHAILGG